jgi:SAM-dependent methyltransferase
MFTRSVRFYDAMYSFKDYNAACEKLDGLIKERCPQAVTLLDVACGTGRHLEWLRRSYRVEGLDLSEEMLAIARERCPDVPFHSGDMTAFDLGRTFDVVTCLFSSIAYVGTHDRFAAAVAAISRHVSDGGIVVIEPWIGPQQYVTGRLTANFVDADDLKMAWMYLSDVDGDVSVFDIRYLVGTAYGIECFDERHEMGLFPRETYEDVLRDAGLEVEYDDVGLFGRGLYLGRKPG